MFLLDAGFVATFFDNIANFVKAAGSYIVLIVGIALLIVGALRIVKAFAAKGQQDWLSIVICCLLGGLLAFGGWLMVSPTNTGATIWGGLGRNTLDNMLTGAEPNAVGDLDTAQYTGGPIGTDTLTNASNGFDVIAQSFILPFGRALALCIGVVLVIMGIWMLAKHYITSGKSQISWSRMAVLIVLGSILFTSTPNSEGDNGWTYMRDTLVGAMRDAASSVADGGGDTSESPGITAPSFGADPAGLT